MSKKELPDDQQELVVEVDAEYQEEEDVAEISLAVDKLLEEEDEDQAFRKGQRKIMDRAVLSDHPALKNCTRMGLLGHMGLVFAIGLMIGYSISKSTICDRRLISSDFRI